MNKNKSFLYYLLWMIGALILVYFGNRFLNFMESKTQTFYDLSYSFIGIIVYSLVFGIYLSLLNGLPVRKRLQMPLFFLIFMPSFLILIYPLFVIYAKLPYPPYYMEIIHQHGQFFLGMLSGLTFMKSFYGSK